MNNESLNLKLVNSNLNCPVFGEGYIMSLNTERKGIWNWDDFFMNFNGLSMT